MTTLLKTLFIIILICISIAGILFICAVIGTMVSYKDDDYDDYDDIVDENRQ